MAANPQTGAIGSQQCIDAGCDPMSVGDGYCNLECYLDACRWDGGDCGGSSFDGNLVVPQGSTPLVVSDQSLPQQCKIQPNELYKTPGVSPFSGKSGQLSMNMWEVCNGYAPCDTTTNPPACSAATGCGNCEKISPAPSPLPANFNSGGAKCEFCATKKPCSTGTCRSIARQLVGIQYYVSTWDPPLLPSGISVFDFDRMSGLNFTTPASFFTTGGVDQNSLFRPLVQHTCAGELGVNAFNGYLQAGAHGTWVQDSVAWFADWTASVAQCRYQTVAASAPALGVAGVAPGGGPIGQTAGNGNVCGAPPLPPCQLKNYQLETRFFVHHPAFWAYQRWYLGNGDASTTVPNCQWGNCYMNTLWDRTRDPNNAVFGRYDFYDPLSVFGMLREPIPPITAGGPGPNGIFDQLKNIKTAVYLFEDSWSRGFRMLAPSDSLTGSWAGSPCNWDSLAGVDGNYNPAPRSCRITNIALHSLFADKAGNLATNLRLHFDLQIDRGGAPTCAGMATGASNPLLGPMPSLLPGQPPYPTATLNPANPSPGAVNGLPNPSGAPISQQGQLPNAGLALPPFALFHEGYFSWFFSNPRPCFVDADCQRYQGAGVTLYCTDLDSGLFNLKGLFPARNIDPIAMFVFGRCKYLPLLPPP